MKVYICSIILCLSFYEKVATEIGESERYVFRKHEGVLSNMENVIRNLNINKKYTKSDKHFENWFGFNEGKEGYKFGFDAGNPDIHGEIFRPCQAYDTFCIRKFFAEHSHCKISGRAVPGRVFRAEGTFNYPHANMSMSEISAEYSGINNGRVEEFYINKATDNLVIAFRFEAVSQYDNNTILTYYLRGREPIVTNDISFQRFNDLTITVIIPHIDDLRLDRAEIYTYGNSPVITYLVGPGVAVSSDPDVPVMYAALLATIPLAYQEQLLTIGQYIAGLYLQYNICEFGVKVL